MIRPLEEHLSHTHVARSQKQDRMALPSLSYLTRSSLAFFGQTCLLLRTRHITSMSPGFCPLNKGHRRFLTAEGLIPETTGQIKNNVKTFRSKAVIFSCSGTQVPAGWVGPVPTKSQQEKLLTQEELATSPRSIGTGKPTGPGSPWSPD